MARLVFDAPVVPEPLANHRSRSRTKPEQMTTGVVRSRWNDAMLERYVAKPPRRQARQNSGHSSLS